VVPGADRSPSNPIRHRSRLTDALVQRLRPAEASPYRVADAEQAGLFIIIGRRSRSFTVQADLRQNCRRAATLKRVLGRAPAMSVRAARAAAREFLGAVARGEDPDRKQVSANLTVAQVWALYETEHLRRLGRSELTIKSYRYHVECHLKDWANTPLAELAREPRRAAEKHAVITKTSGPAQANGVMRTLRILYRFGRRQAPGQLPAECATSAVTFHPQKRRNTALGFDELAVWHKQRRAICNPIRREFHLLTLLSGSRPGALKCAQWEHLDVRRRVLHVPRPKGGVEKAFDIPLSRQMLRSLWRVRDAGRRLFPVQSKVWIFPAASRAGSIAEHKESRIRLSHFAGDLRQTFRTTAQMIGIPDMDVRLLMNHAILGVSGGYITRAVLLSTSLTRTQQRISSTLQPRP
jgi:hypothetical protein